MEANAPAQGQITELFNGINNTMRKTRCRANNHNCILVQKALDIFCICLKIFIYRNAPQLDFEILGSFIICRMSRFWNYHFWFNDSLFRFHVISR
eukprot:Gb_27389 [translate_table: standard]